MAKTPKLGEPGESITRIRKFCDKHPRVFWIITVSVPALSFFALIFLILKFAQI